ncbi:MAG TPA: hypothetical protein VGH74_16045 [Planctomycetaceae bacterium]
MELHEALDQLSEIRLHVARTESFRGYRSATAAFSGVVALATAAGQPWLVPEPAAEPGAYLMLWICAAILSVFATGVEMVFRCRRAASPTAVRMTWMAVEQFLPCTIAGAVVTFVIAQSAAESVWLLPGLWGILFSLGVFASSRMLPRQIVWVGLYYLACGALSLALAQGPAAFSPWAMAGTFGGGQFLAAIVLYLTLERNYGESNHGRP